MFNAAQFCEDFAIEIPRTRKNTRHGWVNIQCPFCNDESNHGGFNVKEGYYNCFRCGGHWLPKIIAKLTNSSIEQSKKIILQYSNTAPNYFVNKPTSFNSNKEISLPPLVNHLLPEHIEYLRSRRFDDKVIRTWKLQSTLHYGNYSHRIFAPIYFQNKIVSYQCRAINNNQFPPYKACATANEVVHHKHIVYGFDYAIIKKRCIVVEGITDVWRLGKGAVATFGKKFTREQLLLLSNNFNEIFIMFDSDTGYGETFQALAGQLAQKMNKAVECIKLKNCDPGDLPQKTADRIMNDLKFRR